MVNVDARLLISEVEKRPVIWDKSYEGYKDKIKKHTAWVAVCECLVQDFNTKHEAQQKLFCKNYFSIINI
jgi:hypothetical protein